MIKWHIYDETGFARIYDDSVDEGVFYGEDGSKKILFRKGNKVMAFFYYGQDDIMVHFSEIIALTDVTYSKEPL